MLLIIVTTRKAVRVRIGHGISVIVVVVLRMAVMIIGDVCIAGADLHRLLLLVMVLIVTE